MAAEYRGDIITAERTQNTNRGENKFSKPAPNDDDDNKRKKDALDMGAVIISENKSGDWRKTLSGAIDEERLIFALVALLIFYIGYAAGNAHHDNSGKDEYFITRNCTCKPNHRNLYISWLTICSVLWIIIHLFIEIFGSRCFKRRFKGCCCLLSCCDQETKCDQSKYKNAYDGKEIPLINDKNCCNQCCIAFKQLCCSKIKSCIFDNDDIHRYENYLWTQYYELYVIGITKDIKMFSDKSVTKIFIKHLKGIDKVKDELENQSEDTSYDETDSSENKSKNKSQESSRDRENKISAHDIIVACPIYYDRDCGDQFILCLIHYCIRAILWLTRFFAQLVLVPFLMIQMLDTYAFLCIAVGSYCTPGEKDDLHLHQTAISFGFYCSLMLSYVTSIMLRWIPRPKRKSKGTSSLPAPDA